MLTASEDRPTASEEDRPTADSDQPEIVIGRGFRLFNRGCLTCKKKSKEPDPSNEMPIDKLDVRLDRLEASPDGRLLATADRDVDRVVSPEFHRHRFDVNMYATKKSAANGLMDLALLMANASQLKHILINGTIVDGSGSEHRFYYIVLSLLLTSIALQILIGIALLYLARQRVKENIDNADDAKRARRADLINNWVVAFIFILTVVNVFISAFGLEQAKKPVAKS